MSLYEISYEVLSPRKQDSIIVIGDDVLPLAMYMSGAAYEEGIPMAVKAIISPNDNVQTFYGSFEYAKENLAHLFNTIRQGTVHTFLSDRILDEDYEAKYNKAIIVQKGVSGWRKRLEEIVNLKTVKKITMILSSDFTLPFADYDIKKENEAISFDKLLKKMGFKVESYDLIGDNLYAVIIPPRKMKKMNDHYMLSHDIVADLVHASVSLKLLNMDKYDRFVVSSGTGYLYLISASEGTGLFNYHFFNGDFLIRGDVSKNFYISVLPDTPSVIDRLLAQNISIMNLKKARKFVR